MGVSVRMYKEKDVLDAIGKNLQVIRIAIKTGEVHDNHIRTMAKKMGGFVLGTFTEKIKKEPLIDVFNFMLDTWYEEVLCRPGVDAVQLITDILADVEVGQYSLARKMVPLHDS